MHLADAFIQSDLVHSGYTVFNPYVLIRSIADFLHNMI